MDIAPKAPAQERQPSFGRRASFVDQLLSPQQGASDIPENIRTNPQFAEAVQSRGKLIRAYDTYQRNLKSIQEDTQARDTFFIHYSKALSDDNDLLRSVLYIPLSCIASAATSQTESSEAFMQALRGAYTELLSHIDFRADFNDGDAQDISLRRGAPPDYVVKIVHLMPWLLEYKIVSEHEFVSLVEHASTLTLRESLGDAMRALHADKRLPSQVIQVLSESPHSEYTRLIPQLTPPVHREHTQRIDPREPKEIIAEYLAKATTVTTSLDSEIVQDTRNAWLIPKTLSDMRNTYASKIAPHITSALTHQTLNALLSSSDARVVALVYASLRSRALDEHNQNMVVTPHTASLITEALTHTHPESREVSYEIHQLRLYAAGLGITLPDGSKAREDERRMERYRSKLTQCAKYIESNPTLSRTLYPVTLSLGSHAKGYAHDFSDTDMGVFVRPGTNENERPIIQRALEGMCTALAIDGSCMEFWIDDLSSQNIIKNYINPDPHRGDSTLTHPFTGEWVGNLEATQELRQALIRMYLASGDLTIVSTRAHDVWVSDIEHNLLQYRLMHRGYYQHFAKRTSHNKNHFALDGDSAFYDEGFREVAFGLYLRKVFMPEVGKSGE